MQRQRSRRSHRLASLFLALSSLWASAARAGDLSLLNASQDATRGFYSEFNEIFSRHWLETSKEKITVSQSHGDSSKQARAVIDGLDADVLTANQAPDIDLLFDKGRLIPKDWAQRLPYNSSPTTSAILFLVRKGNPKHIKDWNDLVHSQVSVVVPNPKTSGNGRYSYLSAWTFALKQPGGDETKARAFVASLFKNVPLLDKDGAGAITTFADFGIGDALLTLESEANSIRKAFAADQLEVIAPSVSILAENPVVWVDKVVLKHHTAKVARAYLEFLYSESGQELAATHYFRPRNRDVLARHRNKFPEIQFFSVLEIFGGWGAAQKTHFNSGGVFDQISSP